MRKFSHVEEFADTSADRVALNGVREDETQRVDGNAAVIIGDLQGIDDLAGILEGT